MPTFLDRPNSCSMLGCLGFEGKLKHTGSNHNEPILSSRSLILKKNPPSSFMYWCLRFLPNSTRTYMDGILDVSSLFFYILHGVSLSSFFFKFQFYNKIFIIFIYLLFNAPARIQSVLNSVEVLNFKFDIPIELNYLFLRTLIPNFLWLKW